MELARMNDIKKKVLLSLAGVATVGAVSLALSTNASADTVKTVVSGDTLWGISQTTGESVNALKANNKLTSDIIYIGQKLTISGPTASTSAPTTTQTTTASQTVQSTPSQSTTTSTQSTMPLQTQPSTTPSQAPSTTTQTATALQTVHSTPSQSSTVSRSITPSQTQSTTTSTQSTSDSSSAKAWIAQHESGGSYTAQNGTYYGKYQLSSSYLHGDYSAANQEKVADNYVASRYGSWNAAKAHWLSNGWY